jgi:hypothetical protein
MSKRSKRILPSRKPKAKNGKEEIKEIKKELQLIRKAGNMPRATKGQMTKSRRKGLGFTGKSIASGMANGIGATLRENPSTRDWPKVYMNPFLKLDARLPCWPARSSLCQYRFAQGYGTCNATGYGWVNLVPLNMICNDAAFITFSNSPGSGDGVNTGTGNGEAGCGGAYTTYSFVGDNAFAVRLVAFGVKIKYTGSQLNKGGFLTYFQNMPRGPVDTLTSTIIQSEKIEWKQYDFGDKFSQYNRMYTENDDSQYNTRDPVNFPDTPWIYDDFGTPSPENYNYMCATINAATANMPFEWHVAGHFELIGPLNNTTGISPPTVNTAKLEKTVNGASALRAKNTSQPDHTGENGIPWGAIATEIAIGFM